MYGRCPAVPVTILLTACSCGRLVSIFLIDYLIFRPNWKPQPSQDCKNKTTFSLGIFGYHSAPEQNQDFWNAPEKRFVGFENTSKIEKNNYPNFIKLNFAPKSIFTLSCIFFMSKDNWNQSLYKVTTKFLIFFIP